MTCVIIQVFYDLKWLCLYKEYAYFMIVFDIHWLGHSGDRDQMVFLRKKSLCSWSEQRFRWWIRELYILSPPQHTSHIFLSHRLCVWHYFDLNQQWRHTIKYINGVYGCYVYAKRENMMSMYINKIPGYETLS